MDHAHFLGVWGLSLKAGHSLNVPITPGLSMDSPVSLGPEEESVCLTGLGHLSASSGLLGPCSLMLCCHLLSQLLPLSVPAAVKRQLWAVGKRKLCGWLLLCSQSRKVPSRPGGSALEMSVFRKNVNLLCLPPSFVSS